MLPTLVKSLARFLALYAGVHALFYKIGSGYQNEIIQLASYYLVFLMELSLVLFHYAMMFQPRDEANKPYFLSSD